MGVQVETGLMIHVYSQNIVRTMLFNNKIPTDDSDENDIIFNGSVFSAGAPAPRAPREAVDCGL